MGDLRNEDGRRKAHDYQASDVKTGNTQQYTVKITCKVQVSVESYHRR